jgi:hypothetical protein
MKNTLLLAATLCGLASAPLQAQTTVQVDSTKSWGGWMNVSDLSYNYLWGQSWGTAALTAYFDSTNAVVLMPNTNCWNATDPYWVSGGAGAKWMEADFYVDTSTALGGQDVTFTGLVLSNTLVSPYTSVAFVKEFGPGYSYVGITTVPLVTGETFTVTRTIGAGNITQYGFMTTGPNADPATVNTLGKVAVKVNNADPSIPTALTSQSAVEGQNIAFTIDAKGTAPLSYQWLHVDSTQTTNTVANSTRITGALSNTLTISNLTVADAGTYIVVVTNPKGSGKAAGQLVVQSLAQVRTNMLINGGFETDAFVTSPDAGWVSFNGCKMQNTNNNYYYSANYVTVVGGSNCLETYSTGLDSWNGAYQDRPATAGQVYTAEAWFLTHYDDQISGTNQCYLEVQFRDANNNALRQYSSAIIDSTFPTSTWIKLTPTNVHAGDFVTSLGTASYMVAPAGTAKVRFQVTYHGMDGAGSVYVDEASLKLKEPLTTAAASASGVQISFPTLYGPYYQVYYKTNLSETTWHALGSTVTGDGNTKTVTDPATSTQRYYIVNTLQ